MKNPYPEFTGVIHSWGKGKNPAHTHWQKGYDAKEKEDQGLYEALVIADEVICQLCKRLNPQHAQSPYNDGCESCGARDARLQAIAKWEDKYAN